MVSMAFQSYLTVLIRFRADIGNRPSQPSCLCHMLRLKGATNLPLAVPAPGVADFPPNNSHKDTTMAIERTFSIIKPDATRRNLTGKIIAKFEDAGLRVVASKRIRMTREQAQGFYAVHKERPFYGELVEQMIAAPVVVQVLEGENAILKNREIMGATNPANADAGTIRKEFALSVGENSVHGSDAPETAAQEIKFFFTNDEIVG
jgi:nucleoside-diphosphate kinase